jgi:sugar phosphate isomerase/epimerase
LAGQLGCGPLVFGSPLNRLKGERTFEEAVAESLPVFRKIGTYAARADCTFCIEPNATGYGCDFVTKLAEAASLVEAVATSSVGLVVDTGNMEMAGDDIADLKRVIPLVRHLHISRARLAPIDETAELAQRVLRTLKGEGYDGIVTIEMRPPQEPEDGVDAAFRAVETVRRWLDA